MLKFLIEIFVLSMKIVKF